MSEKFVIKVNRATIVPNPYHGRVTHWIPGNIVEKGDGSYEQGSTPIRAATPEGPYVASYLPTTVTCKFCRESFDSFDLVEDYTDDDNVIENGCPRCRESRCCDLEYESVYAVGTSMGIPVWPRMQLDEFPASSKPTNPEEEAFLRGERQIILIFSRELFTVEDRDSSMTDSKRIAPERARALIASVKAEVGLHRSPWIADDDKDLIVVYTNTRRTSAAGKEGIPS